MLAQPFQLIHQIIASNQVIIIAGCSTIIPLATLLAGIYVLITQPQHDQRRKMQMVAKLLSPGVVIQTANGLNGTVILVMNNSVVVELSTGQKVEILKQSITAITHDKHP